METGYPTWLVILVSFIMGAAVVYGIMLPMITPDYQRGYKDGYSLGRDDAWAAANKNIADLHRRLMAHKTEK